MYAASSNATYVNQQVQQSSSSSSQNVRRIAIGDDNDVCLFDIGTNVAFPDAAVRVVSDFNNCWHCEEFFIGDSDSDGNVFADCMPLSVYSHDVDWTSVADWSQAECKAPGTLDVADSFGVYDICKFSAVCAHPFSETNWIPVSNRAERRGPQVVRAVVHEVLDTSIVIDSGSDAAVVPLAFESCGMPIEERGSIQDCQGNKIPTAGMREFQFVLWDVNGKTVVLKDYGFLSEHVSGPLILYGHLFRNGWGIEKMAALFWDMLTLVTGVCLAIDFRNDSFIAEATIRQVASVGEVRAIKVDVPESWSQGQTGWNETVRGFPLARTNGNFFVDPIDRYSFEDFPYRTTLSFNGRCWEQVERCGPLSSMEDRCRPLNSMGAITILTPTVLTSDGIGCIVCADHSQQSSRFLYPATAPASSSAGRAPLPEPQPVLQLVPAVVSDESMQPDRVRNPAFQAQREGVANPVDSSARPSEVISETCESFWAKAAGCDKCYASVGSSGAAKASGFSNSSWWFCNNQHARASAIAIWTLVCSLCSQQRKARVTWFQSRKTGWTIDQCGELWFVFHREGTPRTWFASGGRSPSRRMKNWRCWMVFLQIWIRFCTAFTKEEWQSLHDEGTMQVHLGTWLSWSRVEMWQWRCNVAGSMLGSDMPFEEWHEGHLRDIESRWPWWQCCGWANSS